MSKQKPYRKEVSIFLIHESKKKELSVLAKNAGTFMIFPGGGVDKGESIEDACRREVLEETGITINKLKFISDVKSDFYPEWAQISAKRKKRYKRYKGGHIFIFVGTIKKTEKPKGCEDNDDWKGDITKYFMPIKKCIKLTETQEKKQHINNRAFRGVQKAILNSILVFKK